MAPEPRLWEGSPFPGLRAFGPSDAPIFFGRGRETDGLVSRLHKDERFTVVVGASGSGKSSLVAAGLLPRLTDNAIPGSRDWAQVRFTPGELGDNPRIALYSGFKAWLEAQGRTVRDEAMKLQENPGAITELISLALDGRPDWVEVLLFIDQFEELFTVVDAKNRGPFVDLLEQAVKAPRLCIVATLRADFYHYCVEQPALAELLRAGSYPLSAPGVGALFEMIDRPAARAGLTLSLVAGLAAVMLVGAFFLWSNSKNLMPWEALDVLAFKLALRSVVEPEMIEVPAATFSMGSKDDDPDALSHEKPQLKVTMLKHFSKTRILFIFNRLQDMFASNCMQAIEIYGLIVL